MNNCEYIKKLINQQLDNELDQFERKQLDDHLHKCDSCKTYSSNMLEIHNQLLFLSSIDPKISFVDEIFSDIDNIDNIDVIKNDRKSKIFNRRWFKTYGVAIAAAIVLFIPITLSLNQNLNLTNNNDNSYFSLAIQEESVMDVENSTVNDTITSKEITDDDGSLGERGDYGLKIALINDFILPYIIEIENNQLVIYQDDEIIYKSNIWADNLYVDYYQVEENEIIYSLFSKDNDLIASYKIDLLEKTEESIGE